MKHPLGENRRKARLSSLFGVRTHPITGKQQMHNGVDLAVAEGTPVISPWDAEVLSVNYDELNGNYVRLRHGTDVVSVYCHMNGISDNALEGKMIAEGAVIGWVGSTGRSTGPHLHFGIMLRGQWVDPIIALAKACAAEDL